MTKPDLPAIRISPAPRATAVPIPLSFLSSHKWSMGERTQLRWRVTALPWPLFAVLAVQAALAVRLIWSNTAYIDEATYLYGGSQELNHWLHGAPVTDYQLYFSGSPAVYPPIGAAANAIGGLAGARILGLLFVMGSTCLLYATALHLFDRRAAALGTALFATLGITQFLSAFATYDPMALFLLTLSAYLTIGYKRQETMTSAVLVNVAAPVALALADAAKYATVLWNPVVIGLTVCGPVLAGSTWKHGLGRAARFIAALAGLIGFGLAIGKGKYITGIEYTTLSRSQELSGMDQPASLVFHDTWFWISVVLVLAAAGLIIASATARPGRRIAVLTVAGLLLIATVVAPGEQARIGTTVSLHKHLVFGAWFGCILAGYALRQTLRWRFPAVIACAALLTAGAWYYAGQASQLYHGWKPVNMAFIDDLRPMLHPGRQRYLMEQNVDMISYYAADGISSLQWKNSAQYSYVDPQTGRNYLNGPAFADAIRRRVFTLIALDFSGTFGRNLANDADVVADIKRYGGYRVIGHLPSSIVGTHSTYTVWRVTGASS